MYQVNEGSKICHYTHTHTHTHLHTHTYPHKQCKNKNNNNKEATTKRETSNTTQWKNGKKMEENKEE
jgi:hypothetical protein